MVSNVYGNASVLVETKETDAQAKRSEFSGKDFKAVSGSSEIDLLQQEEEDNARSTRLGFLYGFIFGFVLGIAQLAYIGHGIWSMWGVAMMPIFCGLGWSLVGSIVGCGGILVSRKSTDRS